MMDSGAQSSKAETWLLLDSGRCDAAFNMALDEALLETAGLTGRPVLRFYGWTQSAATFGYFQHIAEIERLTLLRPLIRRPTGGGLVPHATDWTYSLAFPPGHGWHGLRASQSYERVHAWIRDAFTRMGVPTELSPGSRPEAPGQCFVGAEQFDVMWCGRKIAGAAQRRNKLGLLIQGSVQPPPVPVVRSDWQRAVCAVANEQWSVTWEAAGSGCIPVARAEELARIKYSRDEYNRRR